MARRPGWHDPELGAPRPGRRRKAKGRNFMFSSPAAAAFREVALATRASHGEVTFSEMLELLVWHWREHPPEGSDVLRFDFATKRGRPRV